MGNWKAARALGYSRGQIFRHTVLPQAMRAILPPAGNEVIGQLKTTAVVSVISLQDVLYSAQIIYQRTYEVIPPAVGRHVVVPAADVRTVGRAVLCRALLLPGRKAR